MVYEFKFPDVGEGITEGTLVEWRVDIGSQVKTDQSVASVETDKAVVDIPSPVTGTVKELLAQKGDTLEVGNAFMKIETKDPSIGDSDKREETVESEENRDTDKREETREDNQNSQTSPLQERRDSDESVENRESNQNSQNSEVQSPIRNSNPQSESQSSEERRDSDKSVENEDSNQNSQSSPNSSLSSESQSLRDVLAMPGVVHEAKKRGIDLTTITPSGNHGQIVMQDLIAREKEDSNKREETGETNQNSQSTPNSNPSSESHSLSNRRGETGETNQNSQSSPLQESGDSDKRKETGETNQHSQSYQSSNPQSESRTSNPQSESQSAKMGVLASLSVKQKARELGVDINFVVGTGENGKITLDDIKRAKENREKTKSVKESQENSQKEENPQENIQKNTQQQEERTQQQDDNSIGLTGIRGTIANKMQESLNKTAQVTLSDEVEVSKLIEVREREKEKLKEKNIKLSYLPFIIKAVKHATRMYPHFNGRFNEQKNAFEKYSQIHMGVAADTQKGLVVPIIKNAQEKSIVELAQDITTIGEKAKENAFSSQELSGSTFTISSIGSLGAGQTFTPILNYPEAAILGIGRIVEKPVINQNGEIVPGKTMTLSITVDHRIIDGADAARFLKDIMELLKDPEVLLLEA